MNTKFRAWLRWLSHRPRAIINLIGVLIIIFGIFGYVVYNSTRPLDVLVDWTIQTSSAKKTRVIDGKKVSVYNPGETLVFTSKSTKLIEATGTTTRTIVCEATAEQSEREIQLDALPATRPVGDSPKRENAITIPEVAQFAELPRWCKLVIDITYTNIVLGREHAEHAESDRFLVEEQDLDPAAIRRQVAEFEKRILDLEQQLTDSGTEVKPTPGATPAPAPAPSASSQPSPNTGTTGGTTNNNNTTINNPPSDDRSALGRLPVIGGLLDDLGL